MQGIESKTEHYSLQVKFKGEALRFRLISRPGINCFLVFRKQSFRHDHPVLSFLLEDLSAVYHFMEDAGNYSVEVPDRITLTFIVEQVTKHIVLQLHTREELEQAKARVKDCRLEEAALTQTSSSTNSNRLQRSLQKLSEAHIRSILKLKIPGGAYEQIVKLELPESNLKDFKDIFDFRRFPILAELDLSRNQFGSLEMLGYLPNLKILNLESNSISVLHPGSQIQKGLSGCQRLEILNLSYNRIRNLKGLQFCRFTHLKIMKIAHNQIQKIQHLKQIRQLKQLDLNDNRIKTIDSSSFEGENGRLVITYLKLDGNELRNVRNIKKLLGLKYLFLGRNRMCEFADIEQLMELPDLKQLQLNGNKVCQQERYRQILLKKLPTLMYLDGDETGKYKRVQKQNEDVNTESQ